RAKTRHNHWSQTRHALQSAQRAHRRHQARPQQPAARSEEQEVRMWDGFQSVLHWRAVGNRSTFVVRACFALSLICLAASTFADEVDDKYPLDAQLKVLAADVKNNKYRTLVLEKMLVTD